MEHEHGQADIAPQNETLLDLDYLGWPVSGIMLVFSLCRGNQLSITLGRGRHPPIVLFIAWSLRGELRR